jgi:hypothetical protein
MCRATTMSIEHPGRRRSRIGPFNLSSDPSFFYNSSAHAAAFENGGLGPLDRDGVDGYIAHRLHVAGGTPDRVRFSREAIDTIYDASGGVPRLINRLCDRSLHHGHIKHAAVIDQCVIALACDEMDAVLPRTAAVPAASS